MISVQLYVSVDDIRQIIIRTAALNVIIQWIEAYHLWPWPRKKEKSLPP